MFAIFIQNRVFTMVIFKSQMTDLNGALESCSAELEKKVGYLKLLSQ